MQISIYNEGIWGLTSISLQKINLGINLHQNCAHYMKMENSFVTATFAGKVQFSTKGRRQKSDFHHKHSKEFFPNFSKELTWKAWKTTYWQVEDIWIIEH